MKKKGCIITVSIALIIVCAVCWFKVGNVVDCPPYDKIYFEWFPYQEGDTIMFKNNEKSKEYIVGCYTAYHRESYLADCKCGGCIDGVNFSLIGVHDTLTINFQNFRNEENIAGLTLLICNGYQYKIKKEDKFLNCDILLNYTNMPSDTIFNFIIAKEKGLIKINNNHKEWTLSSFKKNMEGKDIKIEIIDSY